MAVTFGPYELLQRLGAGGMGEVFLARLERQDDFQKLLVIKRMLPQLSNDAGFRDLFRREARLAALLSHQNIVQIFDYGEAEGRSFIAMEFVEGPDVSSILEARSPLPTEYALAILQGGLRGLDYAHRKKGPDGRALGLVHRDVAPKNLLVSYEGEVKWIDFGLANALRKEGGDKLVGGTVGYMAPEQADGRRVDARADLFAMGVTAFQLLTGRCPYPDANDNPGRHAELVREQEFPLPSELGLDPAFDPFLCRALSPDPDERYNNARQMLAALTELGRRFDVASPFELGEFVVETVPRESQVASVAARTVVGDEPVAGQVRTVVGQEPAGGMPRAESKAEQDTSDGEEQESGEPEKRSDSSVVSETSLKEETIKERTTEETTHDDPEEGPTPGPGRSEPEEAGFRWGWMVFLGLIIAVGGLTALWLAEPPASGTDTSVESESASWTLEVTSVPASATVSLGGEVLGTTPLSAEGLEPSGSVELVVQAPGHKVWTEQVVLGEDGGTLSRQVELLEETAFVEVTLFPADAKLTVNGEPASAGENGQLVLPPGMVVLAASLEGYEDATEIVELEAGETHEVVLNLEAQPAELRVDAEPKGATIRLTEKGAEDGRTCVSPCLFSSLTPGEWVVVAQAEGHEDTTEELELKPGAREAISLRCPVLSGSEEGNDSIVAQARGGRLIRKGKSGSKLSFDTGGFLFRGGDVEATVALERSGGSWLLSVRTDPWARFSVGGRIFPSPLTYHRVPGGRLKVRLLDENGIERKVGFDLLLD